ncbi:DUF1593 domain-containing protein [candidate division KSB1 bacterium]|nr:DUF1593 domain-containing protein [candidate division KSB1 bacterium]
MNKTRCVLATLVLFIFFNQCYKDTNTGKSADNLTDTRPRVIVSSDIGGTDPDDFQSMVHLLLYADTLDIEGLISSPSGHGRAKHILLVIRYYEQDYPNLKTYSDKYPTAEQLRAITKQGAYDFAGPGGVGEATEGSDWIIRCARCDDPRPLHVLVWGGIEDLAQALHDAPDILPKLRIYYIGGPNKKWAPGAYHYIATHHPNLWIIESNATYRGWFVGGNQSGEWGNSAFVQQHIVGHGELGNFFNTQLGGSIKMGDTPSVARLLYGDPEDPSQPSWGGQFVRAWKRPHVVFDRITTAADSMEQFGILELNLFLRSEPSDTLTATLDVENQSLPGLIIGNTVKFMFSPKSARTFSYKIGSNTAELDGQNGCITAYLTAEENKLHPDPHLPNWWTDDPSPDMAEGDFIGAKTVSMWREEYLTDFKERMDRCKSPVAAE